MSKPKANAQGWIRHNRKTQPVSDGVAVEIRTRDGDFETCEAHGFYWSATGGEQIMAYRILQPEQQSSDESNDSEMPATTLIDGPLQRRDRITEIDAEEERLNTEHRNAIEALEDERVSLVQRLADEGLQLKAYTTIGDALNDLEKAGLAEAVQFVRSRMNDTLEGFVTRLTSDEFSRMISR